MIQSDLLYLKPITKDDAEFFVEIYTDPHVMKHVGSVLSQEAAMGLFENCLKQLSNEQPQYLFYLIKSKRTDEKFGIIGLLWNQPEKNSIELGVMIAKPYINKAYAYKATKLLMKYVFTNIDLEIIVVICNESNIGANRVSRALGFEEKETFIDEKVNQRKVNWQITVQNFNNTKKKQ